MKDLIAIVVLCFLPFFASAQERSLLLGGTISAAYYSDVSVDRRFVLVGQPPFQVTESFTVDVEYAQTSVGFYPYLGRVTSPNITVGLGLDLGFTSTKRTTDGNERKDNGNRLGGYLWLRYTLNPGSKLQLYVEPQLSYAHGKGSSSSSFTFINGSGSDYGLITPIGATYELNERLLLNLRAGSLNLTRGKWTSDDGDESSTYFNAGLRFQPRYTNFGIEFRL